MNKFIGIGGLFAALVFVVWLLRPGLQAPTLPETAVTIPQQSDWTDHGPIFQAGAPGAWDHLLYGGFAASVVKKDGVYYLYYQGAAGYSEEYDTVTWRAIGVATSKNGLHFSKHPGNPVFTWTPTDYLEEGAVSSGAFVDGDQIVLLYGANVEEKDGKINANGRYAASTDGLTFTDRGVALDFTDRDVWGSGDELFPVAAFEDNGRVYVYYLPNGVIQRGRLGVAWGNDLTAPQTAPVAGRWPFVFAWGTASAAKIAENTYVLFTNNVRQRMMRARIVSLDAPQQLSAVVASYQFDDFSQATIFLDEDEATWFMFYRSRHADYYGVKTSPMTIAQE